MKILHLINYFNDTLKYQENFLTENQSNLGHEVQVITSDRFYPFKDYDKIYFPLIGNRIVKKRRYKIDKVNIIRKKPYFESKKYAQCLFFNILDIIKFNPDVIHIHNTGAITFLSTLIYGLFFKKKIFIDCHQDIENTKNNLLNRINNLFWSLIYHLFSRQIIKFLPINESSKNFIIQKYKIKKTKITIVPLGCEFFKKPNISELIKARKKLNFKKDDIIIFNSGKIKKDKKILDLLNLIEILLHCNKKFKLILVGQSDDNYKKKILYKVHSINSKFYNSIKLIPFQKQKKLRLLMCLSNISIWPGVPSISIQESLYCDNILFLPKRSSSYQLIKDVNLTFYNNNLKKTATNIIRIINNKNLNKNIFLRNKDNIKTLSWKTISKNLIKIYEAS